MSLQFIGIVLVAFIGGWIAWWFVSTDSSNGSSTPKSSSSGLPYIDVDTNDFAKEMKKKEREAQRHAESEAAAEAKRRIDGEYF